jgi:hypothetical protein
VQFCWIALAPFVFQLPFLVDRGQGPVVVVYRSGTRSNLSSLSSFFNFSFIDESK